jgi:hypothetical protein
MKGSAANTSFLLPALKIAISLTKQQLIQAEKLVRYGISEKLDMLSIQFADRWADCILIRLSETSTKSKEWSEDTADINKQFGFSLESFKRRRNYLLSQRKAGAELGAMSLDSGSGSLESTSSFSEGCDYLNVDVAEIRCLERDSNESSNNR